MNSAPSPDEVEVCIFGSGYGECVILHLTDNNWIIIDSCYDYSHSEPVALQYLSNIGVETSKSVRLIVCTHWHDDHIRGLDKIYKACPSAEFVISDALTAEEFLYLAESLSAPSPINEGLNVLSSIINDYINFKSNKKFIHAVADRPLFRSSSSHVPFQIYSLSPSDESIRLARLNIARLFNSIRSEGQVVRPLKALLPSHINPNYVSVVLWVKVGKHDILLGSDLEECSNSSRGWAAIISSQTKPDGKAGIFKIPHHGSENAHSYDVWTHLLLSDPVSVCTPFIKGAIRLPKQSDILRIKGITQQAYITSKLRLKGIQDKTVERTLRESDIKLYPAAFAAGFVRVRFNSRQCDCKYKVDCFGHAGSL